jgi:hypothetical protein
MEGLLGMHAEVKAEIACTDTKAGLLLAFSGGVAAGVLAVADKVTPTVAAIAAGTLGLGLLAGAVGVLLGSVRPNVRGRNGFPLWATLTAQEVATEAASRDLAADIAGLSRLAVAKFTGLRRAVDLTRAGGVALLLAGVLAAGGVG